MARYEWSYEESINGATDLTAEQWLRVTWEGAPRPLRGFLPLAWKFGLGLRLGSSADPARVLGWLVARSDRDLVTIVADSWMISAENSVSRDGDRLRWQTIVTYKNVIGRTVWMPARLVHQRLIRLMMGRAIRHVTTTRPI
ncbi:MAG: hypothetical protein ABJC79_15300 [Acidimicrobiia bacterium]